MEGEIETYNETLKPMDVC